MSTLAAQLTDLVRQAAEAAGHGDSPAPLEPCVPTADPRHGDYQSNYAFRLNGALRKAGVKANPRAVAQSLVDALPASELVAEVAIAGPGFINFRLADAALSADVAARSVQADLGSDRPGDGRTMVIDYSSPNIAKRMHVGHLRSTVIGNALHRIHAFLGWTVVADNHVGDWGKQFGMLMVAWRRWRDDEAYAADSVAELQRIYQRFGVAVKDHPELEDLARAETARLQQGDPENTALWRQFVETSLQEFDTLYERLGVRFDVTLGESFYQDRVGPLVERLLADGTAVVDQGAVIVPFDGSDGKGLKNNPLLIRKSDGAALYGTTDLAAIEHRQETWQPDLAVYVTDVRQQLHFRQVFAAARKMGHTMALQHVGFGMLRLAGGAVASTRAGTVLNLVDVLDAAAARAREVVDAKSGHLPEDERAAIAEAVGTGAIKYADLSQNPTSDITFDWDRMLSLEGNTAPYLMYAHARCRSILRKAGDVEPGALAVSHPAERALALAIARTPEAIARAAEAWRPNLLAEHLYGLASALSTFWHDCRVLGEDPLVERSRLALVAATARALSAGMDVLGLVPLERM